MKMVFDPVSKLVLPAGFYDAKQSLKRSIDSAVDQAVLKLSHVKEKYFLTIHAKFNPWDPTTFTISPPVASFEIPQQFLSNTFVFWVSPKRGICEPLWMVPAKKKGQKLKPVFNKQGVAYLLAKGAMPSLAAG